MESLRLLTNPNYVRQMPTPADEVTKEWNKSLFSLTPQERIVFDLRIDCMEIRKPTYKEIGTHLSRSSSTAHCLYQKVLVKLYS